MSQRGGKHGTSRSLENATGPSPRRGKLLELAHRLEDLGRRVEGFIDEQLEHLEQAGTVLQQQAQQTPATSPEELERHREAWQREQRDEIRQIEEDRRVLAEAWIRLESEQRQVLAQRDTMRDTPRRASEEIEEDSSEPAATNETSRSRSRKKQKSRDENKENGRPAMDASTRQAMMRQFQQLRSDVRKHAQRRQQC